MMVEHPHNLRLRIGYLYDSFVQTFPNLAAMMPMNDGWRVQSRGRGYFTLKKGSTVIEAQGEYVRLLLVESVEWKTQYLPKDGVRGKTVLDVGAECGCTAAFFFQNGAKKVIAVEKDARSLWLLERNRRRNGWDMEIFPEPFSLKHLSLGYDFAKIDCEGGEKILLDPGASLNKPFRVELHPRVIGLGPCNEIIRKYSLHKVSLDVWGT